MREFSFKKFFLLAEITLSAALSIVPLGHLDANDALLKVGLYQNPPKLFYDDAGTAEGFFPEILEQIAKLNGWRIRYVRCEWAECLKMLEAGEIDIMPDVARSRAREKRFRFGHEAALHSWSYIYTTPGLKVSSLFDLDKHRIAVLEDSIQHRETLSLIDDLEINLEIVTVDSMAAVMTAVERKQADIGIVNRFFGDMNEGKHKLTRSGVIFNPSSLYFAYPLVGDDKVIDRMDATLAVMKSKPGSPYYDAAERWLSPASFLSIPGWVLWTVFGILAVLGGSVAANAYMSKRVVASTADLRKAVDQANAASRAKTDFLANMSHDLRTPLNSIVGFAEMMEAESLGPLGDRRYKEYAHHIVGCGERLVNLVNDILDISVIESGEYVLREEWIDMYFYLYQSHQRFLPELMKRDTPDMAVQVDSRDHRLFADTRAVSQILDNLVSNALNHSGTGSKITIGWSVCDTGEGDLYVADNGKGIPADQLPLLVDPFVQGGADHMRPSTRRRAAAGVGLGLSIVSRLTKLHGAELLIESAFGKGSKFTIRFPRERVARR